MIRIACKDSLYTYDVYHIVKAFLPREEIEQIVDVKQGSLIEVQLNSDTCFFVTQSEIGEEFDKSETKRIVGRKLYAWLAKILGGGLPWGILTGIRPTKLIMSELEKGKSDDEIRRFFSEHYFVSENKMELGIQIAKEEAKLLGELDYKDGYSVYIGIPFCPTTCSYCSFTSYPISQWKNRVMDYLEALEKEIIAVSHLMKGKKLNTIYIGGGTPTTLEAKELHWLLTCIEKNFSFHDLKEITVEAGRPDSITQEKLQVLREHGISRISINPQTMQQKTLKKIGRKHTIEDISKAFHLAREMGFDNINMDLIAGLPEETLLDMEDTLNQISELNPDSLTIHALAIKRAARMGQEGKRADSNGEPVEQMITLGSEYAKKMEMNPYYMYRQKNIAGSFENVGYSKVDKAGIYNILIMEEKQTIMALGAGATSKIVNPQSEDKNRRIVRIENVKNVEQYILRIDEMIKRKETEVCH